MNAIRYSNPELVRCIEQALAERILVFDGAMGTMIQDQRLDGPIFAASDSLPHPVALKATTTCSA
jgi:methionine synthase I (cobalamin-dependent)